LKKGPQASIGKTISLKSAQRARRSIQRMAIVWTIIMPTPGGHPKLLHL
jgi:hypothetical protein